MAKQRADQLLVDRGLAESRTRAQALILAGLAFVGDRKIDKAGQQVAEDAEISVKGRDHPWVSRGGIKLDHALRHLGWDVTGAVAIDVGSSTGGFTDVLLSRGAARIYAVDSGTNQLAWKLRQDDRVIVHEQTSARIVALIKPQFEAERHEVGKKGVVRDTAVHERVCADVRGWLTGEGWDVADLVESPITGPEGNVEFLIAGRKRTA